MSELIDKIEILGKIQTMYTQIERACGVGNPVAKGVRKAYKAIDQMSTIETEPMRHGRWVLLPNKTAPSKLFKCSECGNITEHKHFSRNGYYPFCKDCGARMDGGF